MKRFAKIVLKSVLALIGLAALLLVTATIVAQTEWFKNLVRQRIVAVAETATGGRVEIGAFNYDWHNLTAEVAPFTLHGTEPPSAPPLFRAAKLQVRLKIISLLKKQFDVKSLIVEAPRVYVAIAPDGASNIPSPKVRSQAKRNFAEQLLDLKVQHFELRNGLLDYNSQQSPLDVRGEGLQASLIYEAAKPRYVGQVSSRELTVASPETKKPVVFSLDTKLSLDRNSIQIDHARLTSEGSTLELAGSVDDFSSPRAAFTASVSVPIKELNQQFALPVEPRGTLLFDGKATLQFNPPRYTVDGKLRARDLSYVQKGLAVRNISVSSDLEVTPTKINLPDMDLSALNGHFRGAVQLLDFKKLTVNGTAKGLALRELAQLGGRDSGQLNGIASGSVRLEGVLAGKGLVDVKSEAKLDIAPGEGGVPVQGSVTVDYDQRADKVQFGYSEILLGSTHAGVSGTLGTDLSVHISSKNLNDVLPLYPLWGQTPPKEIPLVLRDGLATFDGHVTGPLSNLHVSGKSDITHFTVEHRDFDHLASTFDVDKSSANLHTMVLEQGRLRVEGQGRVALREWQLEDAGAISALLTLRGADIQALLAERGPAAEKLPISGTISAIIHVSGTVESPLAMANVVFSNVTAYDEHLDSGRADVTVTATALELSNGEARIGPARITLSGAYNHPNNDWTNGAVRFDVSSSHLTLAQVNHVQQLRKGLGGELDLKATGTAKIVKSAPSLTSLNGELSLSKALLDGRAYGDVHLTAATRLPVLAIGATVNLQGIQLHGSGEWRMEGNFPGEAKIEIPRITVATLHDLIPVEHVRKDLPFDGFIQGDATITGPLNKPEEMRAFITLNTVQLNASPNARPGAGAKAQDLVLKNSQPVILEGDIKGLTIRGAELTAKDTTLTLAGKLALDSKNPWDLTLRGNINLSILQLFNPDLLATGTSVVNMTVHGLLMEPQVDGRLELHDASLFLRDLPNGVDQANGLILFDRNRATVQTLTAVTGGGKVTFQPGSFVGFRGLALVYRLQATADQVRYRSADGISITVDAVLNLIGTSDNSVLSGNVTVVRASFNPRTDVGSLLASTARPIAAPSTPNEYLRGIQFDVQVVSARSLEVETALTRNIQADANLRIRGTPDRPVVLGNVSVNSGIIEFFGNKYSINRGEVNFYNPTKIEPIIDMDLETRVRGIVVDISFSGSIAKLNFSYRSDPPLEANEIIALLAVGRTPSVAGPLASTQTTTNTNYMSTGSNALLGQAIAPATGRLQRLFGVSHIKIDPQLTDLTSVPQARLTLEQQVSPDVTLTYITNLAVANQQIVRVEWDLNKRWSVVALRDENGEFSIDFQFRKRFK